MKHTGTISADGNTSLGIAKQARRVDAYFATIIVTGGGGNDFGGGTVKLQVSGDGTDWIDAKDLNGNAISFGGDGYANFRVTHKTKLRLNTASSTNPTINYVLLDNRGS